VQSGQRRQWGVKRAQYVDATNDNGSQPTAFTRPVEQHKRAVAAVADMTDRTARIQLASHTHKKKCPADGTLNSISHYSGSLQILTASEVAHRRHDDER
jgi:hypothetical protein